MAKRLFVIAGELSGDAHGAGLLRALRPQHPELQIRGFGGAAMRAAGGEGITDWVEDAAVMGVWEVLKRYPWFKERFAAMLEMLETWPPDVLLLIDYPGFNLRFAEAVRHEYPQTKIVYYISPQVWAWHQSRIPKMAKMLDELLCLFPFEKPIFEKAGLKTTFVGHPIVDELEAARVIVPREQTLVGLFPGSREREVARLFPLMIDSARKIYQNFPQATFQVPAATPRLAEQIRALLEAQGAGVPIEVSDGGSHLLMQRATCAVIASGTATLEAAYYQLPYCLVYRVAPLTYQLGKRLVKIPYIGLVNILADRMIVREFIQDAAEPRAIAETLTEMLRSPEIRDHLREQLITTAAMLGGIGAHVKAAAAVSSWLDAPAKVENYSGFPLVS